MLTSTRTRALLLTGIWLLAAAVPTSAGELAESFWRERDELPPAQAESLAEYCDGDYLLPDFPHSTVTAGHNRASAADCTPLGRRK